MPPELKDLLGAYGNPTLVGIVSAIVVASFFSERIAKILGPLGKLGRLWQTRQERAEADAQATYRARRAALEEIASDRLEYLTDRIERMGDSMRVLQEENEGLRDKLGRALTELEILHRALDAQSRDVRDIKRTIDTGERLAVLPPPPPVAGRHHMNRHPPDPDETARIPHVT